LSNVNQLKCSTSNGYFVEIAPVKNIGVFLCISDK